MIKIPNFKTGKNQNNKTTPGYVWTNNLLWLLFEIQILEFVCLLVLGICNFSACPPPAGLSGLG